MRVSRKRREVSDAEPVLVPRWQVTENSPFCWAPLTDRHSQHCVRTQKRSSCGNAVCFRITDDGQNSETWQTQRFPSVTSLGHIKLSIVPSHVTFILYSWFTYRHLQLASFDSCIVAWQDEWTISLKGRRTTRPWLKLRQIYLHGIWKNRTNLVPSERKGVTSGRLNMCNK